MNWETPEYNDIRFGFEVTMYINNTSNTSFSEYKKGPQGPFFYVRL